MIRIRDIDFFAYLISKGYSTEIKGCAMIVNISKDQLNAESCAFKSLRDFLECKRRLTSELRTNDCFNNRKLKLNHEDS